MTSNQPSVERGEDGQVQRVSASVRRYRAGIYAVVAERCADADSKERRVRDRSVDGSSRRTSGSSQIRVTTSQPGGSNGAACDLLPVGLAGGSLSDCRRGHDSCDESLRREELGHERPPKPSDAPVHTSDFRDLQPEQRCTRTHSGDDHLASRDEVLLTESLCIGHTALGSSSASTARCSVSAQLALRNQHKVWFQQQVVPCKKFNTTVYGRAR